MNTEQSYPGKDSHAKNPDLAAKTAPQTLLYPLAPSANVSQRFIDFYMAEMLDGETITVQECHRTHIIYNPDDSMKPAIARGGYVAVVQLELTDPLPDATVVVMITADQPQTYFMGRVVSADQQTILLSRDNPSWTQRRVNRSELVYLGRAVYMMYGKVE